MKKSKEFSGKFFKLIDEFGENFRKMAINYIFMHQQIRNYMQLQNTLKSKKKEILKNEQTVGMWQQIKKTLGSPCLRNTR